MLWCWEWKLGNEQTWQAHDSWASCHTLHAILGNSLLVTGDLYVGYFTFLSKGRGMNNWGKQVAKCGCIYGFLCLHVLRSDGDEGLLHRPYHLDSQVLIITQPPEFNPHSISSKTLSSNLSVETKCQAPTLGSKGHSVKLEIDTEHESCWRVMRMPFQKHKLCW